MSKPETNNIKPFKKSNQSLQQLLHTLLTRLCDSSAIIKSWPEGGDDNSVHAETTTKLIASIHKIVDAIRLVEEKVNPNLGDDTPTTTTTNNNNNSNNEQQQEEENNKPSEQEIVLANQLRQTAVPLDLLDMMDANSLNPDCFARGLLSEALRQFSNLQSRKASMNMLAQLVEKGFEQKERDLKILAAATANTTNERLNPSKEGDEKLGVGKASNDERNESKKRKRETDNVDDDDTPQQPAKKEMKM